MLHSFECIRIGLTVGIGGGIPSDKHDIRLDDIVVGCPVKKEGGIVPCNFGKAIQHQEFEPIGFELPTNGPLDSVSQAERRSREEGRSYC